MTANDPNTALLFDIDFTLLTTDGAGRAVIEKTFAEMFHKLNVWRDIDPSGKTDRAIFSEICRRELLRELDEEEERKLITSYIENYKKHLQGGNPFSALPGVEELLASLADMPEFALGIQTGNVETIGRLKLKGVGLEHYFSLGTYCTKAYDKTEVVLEAKQLLNENYKSVKKIIIIGDAPRDIIAGFRNGCRTIGVASGNFTEAQLLQAGADRVLPNLRDLQKFLSCVASIPL